MVAFIFSSVLLFAVILSSSVTKVTSHGYIYDPPGRSSMWRVGFSVAEDSKNYNDMELNCGGREVSGPNIQYMDG